MRFDRSRAPPASIGVGSSAAQEAAMTRRSLHRTVAWSTLLAVTVQFALAAVVAAVTGGADWPVR
jgi:hypothetical protein